MKFRELFDKDMKPLWDKIEIIKEFAVLKNTPQSTAWHMEGNVMNHVKRVVEVMEEELFKMNVDKDSKYYLIMMSAALCHDLGKATTTKWDKEKNDWVCSHHGEAGENITRLLFYEDDFILRELVCYMVRWHMNLHHILDNDNIDEVLTIMAQGWVSIKDMLILNKCDSLGSKNDIETYEFLENRWNTIKGKAKRLGIFEMNWYDYQCREVCRERNRKDDHLLLPLDWRNVKEAAHEILKQEIDKGNKPDWKSDIGKNDFFTVYMMVGLPGSGKDTLIKEYLNGIPIICRDDIRTEIGIKGEKPQGNKEQEDKVTKIFEERMIENCKKKQSFVINNTNLKKQYRKRFLEIIRPYEPKVIYIYVEAPSLEDNYKRREGQIKPEVIKKMALNFDFPLPSEFNYFFLDIQRKEDWQDRYGNLMYSEIIDDYLKH